MKIGIFSTFIEPDALKLVDAVTEAVRTGMIPDSEVSFIFSNREKGENALTDEMLVSLSRKDILLVTESAYRFKKDYRDTARAAEKLGDKALIKEWRNMFGEEVMPQLPDTDVDLLLGDMWVWGDNLCEARNGINLHPALPWGPKGEWYNVVWDLIENEETETGVMMHKVTPDLDRGPAVTFTRFPIRGYQFDAYWNMLPLEKTERQKLVLEGRSEKEKATNPLFRAIREQGFERETPLIIATTKAFAEGQIRIENGSPITGEGIKLQSGYELTGEIDVVIRPKNEGKLKGKERA